MAPITDMLIEDFAKDDTKQIYALCGKQGNRSMLRVLRHGVSVSEIAAWLKFSNTTLVLSIGEQVDNLGF
jgi:hypothetical protein